MGYDPKATLVKKEVNVMANGDKLFLKLMKEAIQDAEKAKTRRFVDPATSQKSNKQNQNTDQA